MIGEFRACEACGAYVPSQITGFFAAHRADDPLQSGSVGCGLCLTLGATTFVECLGSEEDEDAKIEVLLNGQEADAPVSRYVAEKMARSPVRVSTQLEMPLGAGFGASGAGALGAAYALNAYFDLGLTANAAASIAHEAEVVNRSGLGDVIAQNAGGMVIRLEPGAPGRGIVDRIPVPPLEVNYVVRGPISTSEVLSDPEVMKDINRQGKACLKELLKKPTLREFMRLSKEFTLKTGLASDWAIDAIEAVQAVGGMASMIMLGDSVFAFGGHEALKEFGEVGVTTVSQKGANLD